jgi:hypothetical protein
VRSSKDSSSKVVSPYGVELRRVTLVGHIVGKIHSKKEREFASITLDDGTETIQVKAWDSDTQKLELVKNTQSGILALVVGRVRQFGDEVYIDPEIVREVEDPNLLTLHRLERMKGILKLSGVSVLDSSLESAPEDVEPPVPQPEAPEEPQKGKQKEKRKEKSKETNASQPAKGSLGSKILAFIKENAGDGGVSTPKIAEFFKGSGASKSEIDLTVIDLLEKKRIREVKVGVYVPAD